MRVQGEKPFSCADDPGSKLREDILPKVLPTLCGFADIMPHRMKIPAGAFLK